jgi:two-component system invasion response regulator UvrY
MIRILIADPDPATRKALILLLHRKLGTKCISEVGDVEALIGALAESPPDVLLLDWQLYGSPAAATSRLLRKAYPALQIILLSVDASDAAAAKKVGAEFVHKGASPDELIATLSSLLRKQ